jgi:MFS transporter, DHA3 family, tetracycline resistance protein
MLLATVASVHRIEVVGLDPLRLILLGTALEVAVPAFAAVLTAQVVWGVGYTFIGGALQAWIADEATERDLGRVNLRGEQAGYLGSLVGVAGSVLLAPPRSTCHSCSAALSPSRWARRSSS